MGVLERRRREKEELRTHIVEAASELFVEQGYENVTIRRIAEKIEYSPSTIYLYFKDKTELLNTICAETFEQLNNHLSTLLREHPADPLDLIRDGARAYIEFGVSHPNHYLITFCLPANAEAIAATPEDDKEDIGQAGLEAFGHLRECLRQAMDHGAIGHGDLDVLSQNLWMFMHGITSILINSRCWKKFPFANHDVLVESGIELIVRSVRAGQIPGSGLDAAAQN